MKEVQDHHKIIETLRNDDEYYSGIGKNYLSNLSFDAKGEPQIRMSHLNNADRASAEDFSGLFQVTTQLIDEELVM